MMDVLYILITIAFFVVSAVFARGCERLRREESDD